MDFSLKGFIRGFKAGIPIALGVASYGLVFGILSRQAGLDLLPSLCMSAFVFAGASQFVALDMWATPLPVAAIIITTFVVNIRHFLMGAVLTERFKDMTRFQKYLSLFFLVDETWAYSLSQWKKGNTNAALLAGSGFCLFLAWCLSTVLGNIIGSGPVDPAKWGMDFAFTAIFIFLATGLWQGKRDILPGLIAAAVCLAASLVFKNLIAVMVTGVVTISLLRHFIFI